MSNAARPTYFPAVGRADNSGIKSVYASAKDQAAHTKLKFRQHGQAAEHEVQQRDFRKELEDKERKYMLEKTKATAWMTKEESKVNVPLLLENKVELEEAKDFDDDDVELNNNDGDASDGFDSSSDEDESDDEDDDEAELQAELERIKAERAAAQKKREEEERAREDSERREQAMRSNPLVAVDGSAKLKRRWNDDVIFRNQAKDEPEQKKRFINDTVRSDFHRSFLKKFVK